MNAILFVTRMVLFVAASAQLVAGQEVPGLPARPAAVAKDTSGSERWLAELRPYEPRMKVKGVIRNYGNNYIPGLMKQWEQGFQRVHPQVRFETNLVGSEAAMAGLYGKIADLAFIGREAYPTELRAFAESMGHVPLGIEISSGSFATPHKTFALMVFVNRGNPLANMSMEDLARIYGCLKPGGAAITEWGQLGLTGEWAHRPVHVYGYDPTTGMARFFRRAVLEDASGWSDAVHDFANGRKPGGEVINAGVYVLDALAKDPEGIAYANFLYAGPEVKALRLSRRGGESHRYWEPTRENVHARTYPLTRFTTVFLDRAPGMPVDAKLKEFIRYILSRDGMEAVVRDGAYVPLNAGQIEVELRKLE